MVGGGRAHLPRGARACLPALPPGETRGGPGCWRSGSPTITGDFGASPRSPGWFQRAARLLEGAELCAAHGWLDALLGYMAIAEGDQAKAIELSVRARELGRRLGVVSLEMFALSVEGVALVTEGQTQAGMGCLDEAAAAALAGEYEEIVPAGWTCCLLLDACERVRDYERAGEWCGKVKVRRQDEDQLRHRGL